jgi:hypothetical protein
MVAVGSDATRWARSKVRLRRRTDQLPFVGVTLGTDAARLCREATESWQTSTWSWVRSRM